MSWLQRHQRAEQLAQEAKLARHYGDAPLARSLYATAARAEAEALRMIEPPQTRTQAVTAVSAVSLHLKDGQHDQARQLAQQILRQPGPLPKFAKRQLREIIAAADAATSSRPQPQQEHNRL